MHKRKEMTDAIEILNDRYIKGDPARLAAVERHRHNAEIAMAIYTLRQQAGLTQQQLADKIGTTHSVISRLEDANYRGHSLEMLRRIAIALHCQLEVRIVPEHKYPCAN